MARVLYDPRIEPLSYVEGARRGFPRSPRVGQVYVDGNGRHWMWTGNGDGLAGFGFWGVFTKILGAVAPIFGGGSKDTKAAKQSQQTVQEMNAKLDAIQTKLNEPSGFDALFTKRNIMLMGVGLLAFSIFRGK